jgi:hypothetical protein
MPYGEGTTAWHRRQAAIAMTPLLGRQGQLGRDLGRDGLLACQGAAGRQVLWTGAVGRNQASSALNHFQI